MNCNDHLVRRLKRSVYLARAIHRQGMRHKRDGLDRMAELCYEESRNWMAAARTTQALINL